MFPYLVIIATIAIELCLEKSYFLLWTGGWSFCHFANGYFQLALVVVVVVLPVRRWPMTFMFFLHTVFFILGSA